MFLRGDAEPTPVRELYAVFRRSAQPSDLFVQQLARRDAPSDLSDEDLRLPHIQSVRELLGTPLYDDTRLIVGTTERGIYAIPTTAEAVCFGSFPDGGSGCGQPGPHGVRIEWDDPDDGSSFLLYGIVGDEVESVEALVGGRAREAELGENGYRLEVADRGRDQLQELILHLHGGATDTLNLHISNRLG
jgi:hypothetical protein